MIIPMSIATIAAICAPAIAPPTTLAVITIESAGQPWSIDDDTTRTPLVYPSRQKAIRAARQLLARGHNLDVGLMQVNSANFSSLQITVDQAFDPCTNLWAGSTILHHSYAWAVAHYGPGQHALYHALQAYNSGRLSGSPSYANAVWHAASNKMSSR